MRFTTALFLVSAATLFPTAFASSVASLHSSDAPQNKRQSDTSPLVQLLLGNQDYGADMFQLENSASGALSALAVLTALVNITSLTPPPSSNEHSFETQDNGDVQTPDTDMLKQAITSALSAVLSNIAQIESSMDVIVNNLGVLHDDMEAAGFNLSAIVNPNDP